MLFRLVYHMKRHPLVNQRPRNQTLSPTTSTPRAAPAGTTGDTRPAAVALSLLFVLPLYANLFRVARSSYSYDKLSSAVDQALGPLALILGLMGVVLR